MAGHDAIIEASSEQEACAEAEKLRAANAEIEVFSFHDSGLDGFVIEELEE